MSGSPCREHARDIAVALDGRELSPTLREHMDQCPGCRESLRSTLAFWGALRSLSDCKAGGQGRKKGSAGSGTSP